MTDDPGPGEASPADASPAGVCWACESEPAIDDSLGAECRRRLRERDPSPDVPQLTLRIERLGDGYHRLCWNCEVEPTMDISGLCPPCRAELRP